MQTYEKFLFKNSLFKNDFLYVLKLSHPIKVNWLSVKIEGDFNRGVFNFFVQNHRFKIVNDDNNNLNSFFKFLEKIVTSKKELLFNIFDNGLEDFIYVEPKDKNLRVVFLDTHKSDIKEKEGKILRNSYKNADVNLDIIINRKVLIRNFYFALKKLFIEYEIIASFEPPLIDYNYWIKKSDKIEKYLEDKRVRKVKIHV